MDNIITIDICKNCNYNYEYILNFCSGCSELKPIDQILSNKFIYNNKDINKNE